MRYELIIIWYTGEREVYGYATEDDARKAEEGYKQVFGSQIEWSGVRRKRI